MCDQFLSLMNPNENESYYVQENGEFFQITWFYLKMKKSYSSPAISYYCTDF